MPQTLTGPTEFMVNKWGMDLVEQIILWNKITKGKFPIMGTFSTAKLKACRELLEQHERTAGRKKKFLNWEMYRKWEREAECREDRQTRALLYKDECDNDTHRHKRLKKIRQDLSQPPPYACANEPQGQPGQGGAPAPPPPPPAQQQVVQAVPAQPPQQQVQAPPAPPPAVPAVAAAVNLPQQQQVNAQAAGEAAQQGPLPAGTVPDTAGDLYAEAMRLAAAAEAFTGTSTEGESEDDDMDNVLTAVRAMEIVEDSDRFTSHPPVSTEERRRGVRRPQPKGGSGMVTRSKGQQQQQQQLLPLIQYPNPHPPPADGAALAAYRPFVDVQRNWSTDELIEIVKDLPDPKVDVTRWCQAILDLIEMYSPSARELESLFRRIFGLRWPRLRGNYDPDGARNDIVTQQLQHPDGLFNRVREAYPVRTDWPLIHNTKQRLDETCESYRTRLEDCFKKFCGVPQDNAAYEDLLKSALVNGLSPQIHSRVMTSCVGWESKPLRDVWTHAQHAERYVLSQDDAKKKKLETAQLMFFEKKGGKERPQRYNRSQKQNYKQPYRHPDDICDLCSGKGHWRKDCANNRFRSGPQQGSRRDQQQEGRQQGTYGRTPERGWETSQYPPRQYPALPAPNGWTGQGQEDQGYGPQGRAPWHDNPNEYGRNDDRRQRYNGETRQQDRSPWRHGPAADVTVHNPGQL